MKIKKIELINNQVFGDLIFDFTNERGEAVDTIIIAGENGTGKTSLLNLIYELTIAQPHHDRLSLRSEKRVFTLMLSDEELENILTGFPNELNSLTNNYINEIKINFDYSSYNKHTLTLIMESGEERNIPDYFLGRQNIKKIIKTLYSTTEINFDPQPIFSVTAKIIDEKIDESVKSNGNLENDITQLMIDINAQDNNDLRKWVDENPGSVPPDDIKGIRFKRFKDAFEIMFTKKKIKEVRPENGGLKVYFEENGKEMAIENLSSGEKQIVFRCGFLLKDKKSTEGAVLMIDEPEISLHPEWQKKILNFYQNLFITPGNESSSQIIVSTHSPFIIHNEYRLNDKVLILKKGEDGKIFIAGDGKFYDWKEEKIVQEAFNINILKESIESNVKPMIITEGKTDWKHLKRALNKFHENEEFIDIEFDFLEYETEEMGSKTLVSLCESLGKINGQSKIIAIFDRDESDIIRKATFDNGSSYKKWGNHIYSFCIPVPSHRAITPNISIEHYYTDEEIKTEDEHLRRMYIGNEFNQHLGLHNDKDKICKLKNKCGENSIQIIDDGVFSIDDDTINISLTKNSFAQNILDNVQPFDTFDNQTFKPIFETIQQIIND